MQGKYYKKVFYTTFNNFIPLLLIISYKIKYIYLIIWHLKSGNFIWMTFDWVDLASGFLMHTSNLNINIDNHLDLDDL